MGSKGSIKAVFLFIVLALTPSRATAQEHTARESFAAAHSLYSAGAGANAREGFQHALDAGYVLADYALYYLASIAFQGDNRLAAREFLLRLREEYPQSIWVHRAELQRIRIEIAEAQYPQAILALRSLRAEKGLKPDVAEEALLLQAQTHQTQGDIAQAYALFQELRSSSPHSRWTVLARAEVGRLRQKHPDIFGLLTPTAMVDEADQLVRERQHSAAEELYKNLVGRDLGPALRLQSLAKLANLYLTLRRRNEALPVLEEVVRSFPTSPQAAQALYQIGTILWNRNDNRQALGYFRRLVKNHPESPHIERAQFASADILESQDNRSEAIRLYNLLTKKSSGPVREDAMWRLAWLHYRARNATDAHAAFKTLASSAKDERYRLAALYWQARTSEQLGSEDTAVRLYRRIFAQGSESYYQTLAHQALIRLGVSIAPADPVIAPPAGDLEAQVSPQAAFHLLRARELAQLKLDSLAVLELDEIHRLARQQPGLRPLVVREYAANQAFARSVAAANQLSGAPGERLLYRYPLAYWEVIQTKAHERNIDPYLVLALIRQESLFDPRARSSAAALGLMQLLPSTATRVAKQLGLPSPSPEGLFDPELNLTLGSQYLTDLLRRYANNWFKAIAAYNAGEAAVDRWEKEIITEDIEEFVERIPYLETRQYVKLVMRNHRIYKSLYHQNP